VLLQIKNPIFKGNLILHSRARAQKKNAGYKYQNTVLHIIIDPLSLTTHFIRSDVCIKAEQNIAGRHDNPVRVIIQKRTGGKAITAACS